MKTLSLHAAMEAEALPLINILDLKEDIPQRIAPPAPAVSYSGNKHGVDIHVVRNGKAPPLTCMLELKQCPLLYMGRKSRVEPPLLPYMRCCVVAAWDPSTWLVHSSLVVHHFLP